MKILPILVLCLVIFDVCDAGKKKKDNKHSPRRFRRKAPIAKQPTQKQSPQKAPHSQPQQTPQLKTTLRPNEPEPMCGVLVLKESESLENNGQHKYLLREKSDVSETVTYLGQLEGIDECKDNTPGKNFSVRGTLSRPDGQKEGGHATFKILDCTRDPESAKECKSRNPNKITISKLIPQP